MTSEPLSVVVHHILDETTSLDPDDLLAVSDHDEFWADLVNQYGTDRVVASIHAAMGRLATDNTAAKQALEGSLADLPSHERHRRRAEFKRGTVQVGWRIEALQHRSRLLRLAAKDERVRAFAGQRVSSNAAMTLARAIRAHRQAVGSTSPGEPGQFGEEANRTADAALWATLDDEAVALPHGRRQVPMQIAEVLRQGDETLERKAARRAAMTDQDEEQADEDQADEDQAGDDRHRVTGTRYRPSDPDAGTDTSKRAPAPSHQADPAPPGRPTTARQAPTGDLRTPTFLQPER